MQEEIKHIFVTTTHSSVTADKGVLIVPLEALETQSLVRPVVFGESSSGKHSAYALAQIALTRFEDRELNPAFIGIGETLTISKNGEEFVCSDGLVIGWTEEDVVVWAFENNDVKKLLKIAHRACTRWIRLDVH